MSTPTKGPWTVNKYSQIITPTREVLLVSGVALPNGIHPRIEEAEANAAYIVRACNAHEELVNQLRLAQRMLLQTDWRLEDGFMAEIAAAIAKAEGRA